MRLLMVPLIVPLIAAGTLLGKVNDEPSELQMRGAFEEALTIQVRNALEFVAESQGQEAADELRQKGNDRFQVVSFEKRQCARIAEQPGYRCDFSVNIDLVNGSLQRTLTGRFTGSPFGLTFAHEV